MGPGVTAHCLVASIGVASVCISPKQGVHVYLSENSKPNSLVSRRPQVWSGVSGGWKVCVGIWGHLQVWNACGTSVPVGSEPWPGAAGKLEICGVGQCHVRPHN